MQYSEEYLLDNRYRLIRQIGSGSFGEVWIAHDCETDLDIAVKIYVSVDPQGLDDFKKEFQLSFNFNHTNLLHANYLGVNTEDNRPYLVMPLCPQGSVGRNVGNMDEATLWRFLRDVASGLEYLHNQNPPIIHQDIKPDNVLVLPSGVFVITDFGISKRLKNTLRRAGQQNSSAGAVAYMGPERFSSHYQAVKASDIWSLGATLFELATGDLPFCGMGGMMQKNGADMPEFPGYFSDDFKKVTLSCLALETWDRPTAGQLAEYARMKVKGENASIPWKVPDIPVSTDREPGYGLDGTSGNGPGYPPGMADRVDGIDGIQPEDPVVQGGEKQDVLPGQISEDRREPKGSSGTEDRNKTVIGGSSPFQGQPDVPGFEPEPFRPDTPNKNTVERPNIGLWAILSVVGLASGLLINYLMNV